MYVFIWVCNINVKKDIKFCIVFIKILSPEYKYYTRYYLLSFDRMTIIHTYSYFHFV